MMLIGLTGAHGTGKTTLGLAAMEKFDWRFIKTTVSEIYLKHGLDPRVKMTLDQRLDIQEEILEKHIQDWRVARETTDFEVTIITDRTPACFITFILAEISGYDRITPEQSDRIISYVNRCSDASNELFDMICLLDRSIPFVPATDKVQAVANEAYREHWDLLVRGVLEVNMPEVYAQIREVSLKDRLSRLLKIRDSAEFY